MAEEHKGYVQNGAIPMVFSFFRALYNPSLGLRWSCRYRVALGQVFLDARYGGARGWAEIPKLLRRLSPWLPAAPSLVFGQKLICGQEKSGTSTGLGIVSGVEKCFALCLCPGRCRAVATPCASEGAEWGFAVEMSVVLYSESRTWHLAGRATAAG